MVKFLVHSEKHGCRFFSVDNEDAIEVNRHKWHIYKHKKDHIYYVQANVKKSDGKNSTIDLHRFLLRPDSGVFVDHIDGNGLNNCRSNLRKCSVSQNGQNSSTPKNNKSGFKGVSWCNRDKYWVAHICIKGKRYNLGHFNSAEEGSVVYEAKAKELFGEFYRKTK
jgi:hypothetical protein